MKRNCILGDGRNQEEKGLSFSRGSVRLSWSKEKLEQGKNPATGEGIKIPAKTVVKVRPAKAFKDTIIPPKK